MIATGAAGLKNALHYHVVVSRGMVFFQGKREGERSFVRAFSLPLALAPLLLNDLCVGGSDSSALGIWKIQSEAKAKGGVQTWMSTIDQNDALYWKWLLGPFKYVICIHILELFVIVLKGGWTKIAKYLFAEKKKRYIQRVLFYFFLYAWCLTTLSCHTNSWECFWSFVWCFEVLTCISFSFSFF